MAERRGSRLRFVTGLAGAGVAVALVVGAVGCGATSDGASGIVTPSSTGFTPSGSTPGSVVGDPTVGGAPGSTAAGGTTTSLGKPTLSDASAISTVGLGTVEFGMTVTDAEKAAGTHMVVDGTKNPSCYVVKPESGPEGVSFLISDGRVERVDIGGGKVATRSGVKVGSTEAQVKSTYPDQIQTQPRPDGAPGNALVFVPKDAQDAQFRLVFLTDGSVVQGYRAGRLPQVLAPTGCGK